MLRRRHAVGFVEAYGGTGFILANAELSQRPRVTAKLYFRGGPMKQLSGLDAAFVHLDSRRTPMHVSAVLIYAVGPGERYLDIDGLRQTVSERLGDQPLLRRKLLRVPMDVDTPYWVDTGEPDWQRHVYAACLPAGSDWPHLLEVLAVLHERRLDFSRPLWELCLIGGLTDLQGLPEHCQALLIKMHHALLDGVSLAAVVNALHGESGRSGDGIGAAPRPSYWGLWARANRNALYRRAKLAETMGNLVPGYWRARRARRRDPDLPPLERGGCLFNDRVGQRRSVGAVLLPRERMLAIRRGVRHVTFNDIALSVVGGALRHYLLRHGRLPRGSLTAGVPISLRARADEDFEGNRIATMVVGLGTTERDPVTRLRLVHRYAVVGKHEIDALGTGTVMDISNSISPNLLAAGIRAMAQTSRLLETPVPFHTMVSNVPGPSGPACLDQARLVVPLGLGPLRDNLGLFHIVSNSESFVSLTFTACRGLMPDAERYSACLEQAFAELYAAAVTAGI